MNIKLNINESVYVVLNKGGTYGYRLSVYTATERTGAKNTHNREDLYYPNLKQVANKLTWLGLQGDDIHSLYQHIVLNTEKLSMQLNKYDTRGESDE